MPLNKETKPKPTLAENSLTKVDNWIYYNKVNKNIMFGHVTDSFTKQYDIKSGKKLLQDII